MIRKLFIPFVVLAASSAAAADPSFSFGLFKFDATDYFFPNFYAEGGFNYVF